MTRRAWSDRDRRAMRLGAVAVLGAGLWAGLARPALDGLEDARARRDSERALLGRELGLVQARDRLVAMRDSAGARLLRVAPLLFPAGAGGPEGALVGYLEAAGRASQVAMARLEPVADSASPGGLVGPAVRVEGEGDLEGLLGLLYALEAGTKLIRVDALRVAADAERGVLRFEFTAGGIALGGAPAAREERP